MKYDVLCIGNAIVDLISRVDEEFIDVNGFPKGGMTLVDAVESLRRLSLVPAPSKAPGGSVANTAACLASLGARVGFVGKVGSDDMGAFFRESMSEIGVDFLCETDHSDIPTANCLAFVTPDGERTMSTFLGACVHLSVADIPVSAVEEAEIVFVEGYLLDSPSSFAAVRHVLDIARASGTRVALTLSDSRCVERHRSAFSELAARCDIVIANEKEARALFGSDCVETPDMIVTRVADVAVVTCGARGSMAVAPTGSIASGPATVSRIVDLVGAGDAFAAGFIHSYVEGEKLADCLSVGSKCAAVVIQQQGARPSVNLREAVYGTIANEADKACASF